MIVGMWLENKKARTREFGPTGRRLKKEYRYFHQQLDGTIIDPAECVCAPDFVHGEVGWRTDCPIDDHKARARMALWDWDDDCKIEAPRPSAGVRKPQISQGRRRRSVAAMVRA